MSVFDCQQLIVCASLLDLAFLEDNDLIRVRNGAESVSDSQSSLAFSLQVIKLAMHRIQRIGEETHQLL